MINDKLSMAKAIAQLNEWTYYYDLGKPKVSDKVYDDLYYELEQAEKDLGYVLHNSPTHNISYEVVNDLAKVKHNHPMLSLAKTKDWREFLNYFNPQKDVVGMVKLDGLTCSLRYVHGELVNAETRGDGTVGEDVYHNISHIKNIPLFIDYQDELIIDGEIICTYENFEQFKTQYANPRNFAAGSVRLLDSEEFSKRNLIFVAWYVVKGLESNSVITKFHQLQQLGFTVVPWTSSFDWDAPEFLKNKAEKLGYPLDGLVGRYDDIAYGESLGATGHHARSGFAFKFVDEEYDTILQSIEWSAGRTGVFTPVAVFDPVDTGDSIISRASLHNLTILNTLGIFGKGQKIKVAKQNEIIPQVVWADKNIGYRDPEHGFVMLQPFHTPDICPYCGEPLIQKTENESTFLVCQNAACSGKLINRLVHYCSKQGLDIRGLSEQTLSKLMDWGWINSIADLYELKHRRADWIQKPGFGAKSVDNILNTINKTSIVTEPWRFIAALGIPLIGTHASKDLVKQFTVDELITNAKEGYDFTTIDGFGPEMNTALQNYDFTLAEYLLDNYLVIEETQPANIASTCAGLTFVITGSVSKFANRNELKEKIEQMGGKVTGAVSSHTSYLINNDIHSTSGKNKTAKELNIPIITEQQFMEQFMGD